MQITNKKHEIGQRVLCMTLTVLLFAGLMTGVAGAMDNPLDRQAITGQYLTESLTGITADDGRLVWLIWESGADAIPAATGYLAALEGVTLTPGQHLWAGVAKGILGQDYLTHINALAALDDTALAAENPYNLAYMLLVAGSLAGQVGMETDGLDEVNAFCDKLIAVLESYYSADDAAFVLWGDAAYASVDDNALILAALAMHREDMARTYADVLETMAAAKGEGGYESWGAASCSSTAMVLAAQSLMGLKDGAGTTYALLEGFALDGGAYAAAPDAGQADPVFSTPDALLGLICYHKFAGQPVVPMESSDSVSNSDSRSANDGKSGLSVPVIIGICAVAVVVIAAAAVLIVRAGRKET